MSRLRRAVQTGRRVFLRRPAARDRDAYLRLRRRSAAFLRPWEPAPTRARTEIVRGPSQSAFLGYWIGAPFARQGYMTEALQLGLRHAFRILSLHRVEANIMPANRASIALVKRAGFHREGYSARYLKIAGHWADHERWALTVEDWRALPGGGRGRQRSS